MKNYLQLGLISIALLIGIWPCAVDAESVRFDGKGDDMLPSFTVEGPWLIDWKAHSEYPLLAYFELRLLDASTGNPVGVVAQLEGRGRGLKMFEEPGTYKFEVISRNAVYEISVSEISESQAAELKRASTGTPTLQDSTKKLLGRVREGSFDSWRAENDSSLLLFSELGPGQRIEFSASCPGLSSATALSFVAPMKSGDRLYDSILLDNGLRCYFERVVPYSGN
jgi:hypothetical protein